jgi:hypothetical protein
MRIFEPPQVLNDGGRVTGGITDSPPYRHDGPCLTPEDTVAFFNLVLGLKPAKDEKQVLAAFLRQL